jgi:xylitol oxidase
LDRQLIMDHITHNWSGHVAFSAAATHYPRTIPEVQEIVSKSSKLRPVGVRHSFHDIADTPGDLITLRRMDRRIDIDPASRTVTVDGGINYSELTPVLDAAGWALFNLASSPDFTVAGATSTATHGSGNTNRNLAASVAGIEIVTASGDLLALKRGDPQFHGAVVALGALGPTVSLTLDLLPSFQMRQDVYHGLDFEQVADNFDWLMGSAYSVSLFTHWNGDRVDQAFVKSLAGATLPQELLGGHPAPGESSPLWGGDPTGMTAQRGVPGPWFDRLTHARIGTLPSSGNEVQAEYFIPRSDAPAALRAIKSIEAQLHPALLVSEIRTVAADEHWLSMNYRMDSVALHFAFHRVPGVKAALEVVETVLRPFAPRPHWGKLFELSGAEVQSRYERLGDFRALANRYDPRGKFRNAFLERNVFGE